MIDPVLEALREYESSVAPAYELIRRSRARLNEQLTEASAETIPALQAWQRIAVPDEPNQAELHADAVEQPERVAVAAAPAPVTEPEGGDVPPVVVPPASRHRKETFVCSRCPQTFKTRGWRDRHESKHPPIPDVAPSSGERIRRIPPTVRRGYQLPSDNDSRHAVPV